jgi:hypothetical protein
VGDPAAAISRQAEGYTTSALPTLRSQAELEAYQRAIIASGGPVPVQATAGAAPAAAADDAPAAGATAVVSLLSLRMMPSMCTGAGQAWNCLLF